MDKQSFLAAVRSSHAPLAAAVAALPDDAWGDAVEGMDGWTRADVLAHVGWWSDHSVRVITALREGTVPYEKDAAFDIDVQNRAILEEFRGRDTAAVRAYEADAFDRLVAAISAATDAELFTAGRFPWLEEETLAAAVEWDSTKHYAEHVPHLAASRDRPT